MSIGMSEIERSTMAIGRPVAAITRHPSDYLARPTFLEMPVVVHWTGGVH